MPNGWTEFSAAWAYTPELEDSLSEDEAERVLQVIVDWGRYAELFAYDYGAGVFSAENPGEEPVEEK